MNRILTCAATALLLAGCSGGSVKETLGLETQAPDEFKVVSRPPLSVPPQFNLVPPTIGEGNSNRLATDKQAESLLTGKPLATGETFVLTGDKAQPAAKQSSGPMLDNASGSAESQFLRNAGAENADPSVRKILVEEKIMKQEKRDEASWWEFWDKSSDKKDTLVNAKGEAERIKQTQDAGKPVTEGETPVVKPKDKGVLGRIFGE